MGKKGIPHRKWSKEEKMKIIKLHLEEHIPVCEIERQYRRVKVCRERQNDGYFLTVNHLFSSLPSSKCTSPYCSSTSRRLTLSA